MDTCFYTGPISVIVALIEELNSGRSETPVFGWPQHDKLEVIFNSIPSDARVEVVVMIRAYFDRGGGPCIFPIKYVQIKDGNCVTVVGDRKRADRMESLYSS